MRDTKDNGVNITAVNRDIEKTKTELRRQIKMNFKHIEGMLDAVNKSKTTVEEMLDTRRADALIDKKIISPANNIIECMKGADQLYLKNEAFA
jgi:hypothetical protein